MRRGAKLSVRATLTCPGLEGRATMAALPHDGAACHGLTRLEPKPDKQASWCVAELERPRGRVDHQSNIKAAQRVAHFRYLRGSFSGVAYAGNHEGVHGGGVLKHHVDL